MRRIVREVLGLLAVLFVSVVAAKFAELLRSWILETIEYLYGDDNAVIGVGESRVLSIAVFVSVGILLARWLNKLAQRMQPDRLGLEVIGNAARGEGPGSSLRGTLVRSTSTAVVCAAGTSIGRESAILEAGGAFGSFVGRRLWGFGPAIAAAGISAAFSAAYHAPIGGFIYVGEHLSIWSHRRAMSYAFIGSMFSHYVTVTYFDGHPIFPQVAGDWTIAGSLIAGAVALIPAVLGARGFLRLREVLPKAKIFTEHSTATLIGAIAVSVASIALFPEASGNGMEAIRMAGTGVTIAFALSLGLAKIVATTATLSAKAPGGVFAPTLAVASGLALATYMGLEKAGLDLGGTHREVMVVAMSIGVSAGLHAPWLGAVVIAEMVGQINLIPICMVSSFVAHRCVHLLDRFEKSRRIPVPHVMHDEDA